MLPFMPELLLAGAAMFYLLVGAFYGEKAGDFISRTAQLVLIPFLILMLLMQGNISKPFLAFEGLAIVSNFTKFANIVILLVLMGLLEAHRSHRVADELTSFEFPVLMLFSALGMMLLISANNLMSFYVGLELQSLSLYVLVVIRRDHAREGEAGVKYFVLGAISSALILYGISFIYGYVGTTNFEGIAAALQAESHIPSIVIFAMGLVLAGFLFKLSIVPFHMWAPDVYEGSPMLVTAFLATIPKFAAFCFLIRLLMGPFFPFLAQWQMFLSIVAILSIVLGAYTALFQTNIKRLLAYSSISHMGYALVGLIPGTQAAVESSLIYIVIYVVMTLTTFLCLLNLRRRNIMMDKLHDFAGLSKTFPLMAFVLAVMMFSLAGIPPLAGFFAKFAVFKSAVAGGYYWLAVLGVLASVVGAVYYLKIVKIMYFDEVFGGEGAQGFDRMPSFNSKIFISIGTIIILLFLMTPRFILHPIQIASKAIFTSVG